MDGTVLVADDDRTIRTVLTQALTRAMSSGLSRIKSVTLLRWVEEGKGDLVISDVVMPDGNGIEQLPKISAARPGLPVIIISAQNTIVTAIKAEESDAFDYLPKPFDLPDLMKRAGRALSMKRRATGAVTEGGDTMADDLPLVGRTAAMQSLYQLIARVINAELPVLITGESGTGKSLIARTIHDLSDRRALPFMVATGADLATMDGPASLIAKARNGTILFDEVADLTDEAQSRIVRILDSFGDSGPRVLATSQSDLARRIERGQFRRDLYYRLCGVTIPVPALRDRIDDIELLAQHFVLRGEKDGLPARQIDASAMDLIRAYSWPGNVRQLENTVRRLMLTGGEAQVTRADVEQVLGQQPAVEPFTGEDDDRLSASIHKHLQRYFDLHGGQLPPAGLYQRILREVELPLIEIALDATGGNQAKCADLLGINRNTLRKKITELDIRVTRRRKLM